MLRDHRSWSLMALCAVLCTALLITPAVADEEVHATLKGFTPSGKYIIVNGKETMTKAEVLHSKRAASYLLLKTGYDGVLLLEPRHTRVSAIDDAHMKRNKDGSVDLLASAKRKVLGNFKRNKQQIEIRLNDLRLDLKPNPPLLAWKLCDDLTRHNPEYRNGAKTFTLDEAAVAKLSKYEGTARINIYFGSWCPTCSRYLGRIMRLEEELKDTKIEFHYYGLPKPPAMYRDSEVRRHRIRKLPSGVVFESGKRLGLIVSTRWTRPAREVAKLLTPSEK